jgi:integrase
MASIFKRGGKGPWRIKYFDSAGRRCEHSTKTTDKRLAESIAARLTDKVVLRREGIIDPSSDGYSEANARPIGEHLSAYLAHLEAGKRNERTIIDAQRLLGWLFTEAKVTRLSDLKLDRVEGALAVLHQRGKAARTYNARRGAAVAFMNWAVRTQRVASNHLRHLPKLSEDVDRKHERRALTPEELARLLAVAEVYGRRAWYLFALWGGLRRGELGRVTWGDLDLKRAVLRMSKGKAKRLDEVPIHPDLLAELKRIRPLDVLPSARVFPTSVTNDTRRKDWKRAKIDFVKDGLHADLHSLRATLCTTMALQHVPAEVARRVMRHSDYRTTAKHYTKIRISDAERFVTALPSIDGMPADFMATLHQNLHQSKGGRPRKLAS